MLLTTIGRKAAMIGTSELFESYLLDDYTVDDLARQLEDLFEEDGNYFGAKVIYDNGDEPDTHTYLEAESKDLWSDDKMGVVEYTDSDDREPATISSQILLRFDEVDFTIETRDDWTVEWYSDNCVSLTCGRVGEDHIKQIIFTHPSD
jgi:hypothetical protein